VAAGEADLRSVHQNVAAVRTAAKDRQHWAQSSQQRVWLTEADMADKKGTELTVTPVRSVVNTPAALETQSSGMPRDAVSAGFSLLVSDTK